MKPEHRERQRQLHDLLMDKKRRLWTEVREELFRNLGEGLQDQYRLPPDPGEMSLIDTLSDLGLSVADLRRQELTNMEDALQRLEQGTYGICEDCGEWIPEERLQVAPYTCCCLRCQNKREAVKPPSPTL